MKKVALAVSSQFIDIHPSAKVLVEYLIKNRYEVSKVYWNDETCKWEDFDIVIIRSACDYIDHVDQFLSWVNHVSKVTTLINSDEVIKSSYNKVYLKKLESKGIEILPTSIAENINDLLIILNNFDYEDIVIKGAIGSNSQRTFRFNKNQYSEILATVSNLSVSSKTPLLVQPYFKDVEEFGEVNAMYFNGKYSFAVKRRSSEQNDREIEELYEPSEIEKELCKRVLSFYEHMPVYAKIVYVLEEGKPLLVKVGVIDPNLYFHISPSHTQDFIEAIEDYCKSKTS